MILKFTPALCKQCVGSVTSHLINGKDCEGVPSVLPVIVPIQEDLKVSQFAYGVTKASLCFELF